MAQEEAPNGNDANEMLCEAAENVFSDQTQKVNNLLRSNQKLFSQEVLDKSLLSCCQNGILILIKTIISAGANLEVADEKGNTPLLLCAIYSHKSCARCLIAAGANVNAANFDGNTPLIMSVLNSASIEVTKLLLDHNDIRMDHANNTGDTALICAIKTANLNTIKLLIDREVISEMNEVSDASSSKVQDAAKRKGLLNLVNLFRLQNITGLSPLVLAAIDRDLESAQMMISMDDSIINTTNDSFGRIIIEFLDSIRCNNNVVEHPERDMFEFLLSQLTTTVRTFKEVETIMEIALSIGDHAFVERLSMSGFIISDRNLCSAVSQTEFLRFLLTKRHIINSLNRYNQPFYIGSPLHQAMLQVELESAKALMQHGAFMDIDRALEDAVQRNQEKALQFLISEFPDEMGQKLKSSKLLHNAVTNSSLKIIPILLDYGADINAEHNGQYCLTQAVDVTVLDLLLSRGADPSVKIGLRRHTHPLHRFVSWDFKMRLKKRWKSLQASGVTFSFLNKKIEDFIVCLLQHGAYVDQKDGFGKAALHLAAGMFCTTGVVKCLIDSGADVNKMDDDGQTPLWLAVVNKNVKSVQCLIDAGADINCACQQSGKGVIFKAKNKTILKVLLDNGVDVKTIDGDSPLNTLLAKRHIGTDNVKRLIDAGCDVNHANKDGGTALIHAAWYVDIKLLELLVQEGADVNASGRKSPYLTALTVMFSQLWKKSERATLCINYLVDHNANIDKIDSVAIHVFITCGCLCLIPRFLSRGLAPAYISIYGDEISPLMMALVLNQADLVRYFINIKYLMKSDITYLSGKRDLHQHLEVNSFLESLDVLKTVSQQPLSLETLCFVVISDALGSTQDRRSKVRKLGLPQPLQDLLLFKNATEHEIRDCGIKALHLFEDSLRPFGLIFDQVNSDNEDDDNINFDTDEEL